MNAIEVVFLVRTVGVGAGTVGVVLATTSTGGILGAAIARPLAQRWGTSRTAFLAVTAALPFALLLPLTTSGAGLLVFVAGLFTVDAGVVASNVITSSFRQTYVPAHMLGRVSACTMTASYSMMPAGALLAGGLSEILGIRATLWILAAGIAASSSVYLASPMRYTRDFPDTPARDDIERALPTPTTARGDLSAHPPLR
jgi:MFS family permease